MRETNRKWRFSAFGALGVLLIVAGGLGFERTAAAAPGDTWQRLPAGNVGVGVLIHGPWGNTYANAAMVEGPDGALTWAFCTQASVGGGIVGGTETDVAGLSGGNAARVQANAHRLQAVLDAAGLPNPTDTQRILLEPTRIVDFWGNEVTDPDEKFPYLIEYAQNFVFPVDPDLRTNIAATQGAIWHYTDGFDPVDTSGFTDQAGAPWMGLADQVTMQEIYDRYLELVAIGDAAVEPTPGAVTVSAAQAGDAVVFELTGSGVDSATVAGSSALHPYDSSSGLCDTASTVSSVDLSSGEAQLCSVITADGVYGIEVGAEGSLPALTYLENGTAQDNVISGNRGWVAAADAELAVVLPPTSTTTAPSTTVAPPTTGPTTTVVSGASLPPTTASDTPTSTTSAEPPSLPDSPTSTIVASQADPPPSGGSGPDSPTDGRPPLTVAYTGLGNAFAQVAVVLVVLGSAMVAAPRLLRRRRSADHPVR
ncbi:MAG: thioester domain-containing protein [Microthrixaceae bacterium]|nr:thioester domain-containing protein [Microthrixaceae bacterium]